MNEQDLFIEAMTREDPEERRMFIDEVCRESPTLRQRMDCLFAHEGQAGDYLEQPPSALLDLTATQTNCVPLGTQIGPYKLREQLGEGGMGVVYVAEQTQPVQRKVALKLIRPGMASKDVVARFEAERQALAMMDHPNIAKVLDGGATESGQPYFVMELVQGLSITDYCDEHELSTEARLQLFTTVCRAVQHAHQKGIIHRDLKPSNIVVSEIDTKAVPKVIDFGVAKAVGQKLTEGTLYTHFSQMVGTPLYTSPEQTGLGVVDIDTRSDVYSLGVLLYELLTGNTPFNSDTLKEAGFDEMRRIIREDEPPKPSAMVSTLKADALSTISQRRGSDPRTLSESLTGELDWLVMKALEKDRNQRYESASALADDVERYLADEPIDAGPPSAAYRVKKYAERNKPRLIVAGCVAAMLLTFAGVWLNGTLGRAQELRVLESAVREDVAAGQAAIDGEAYQVASEKFVSAEARLADHPLAPPDKLAEVRGWQKELAEFRRLLSLAEDLQKTTTDREFAIATAEALEHYGVLRTSNWSTKLEDRRLQPSQIPRIRQSVYTVLVHMAFRRSIEIYDNASTPQQNRDSALEYLEAASRITPLTPAFYFVRSKWRQHQGNSRGAEADLESYHSQPPQIALDYYIPARVEHAARNYAKAAELYRSALDVDPRHYPSMENLAVCLGREERHKEKLLCLLMASARHPDAYLPHLNLFFVYLRLPHLGVDVDDAISKAERHFQRVLDLRKSAGLESAHLHPQANTLALVMAHRPAAPEVVKRALGWVNTARELADDANLYSATEGLCYYRLGENMRALEILKEMPAPQQANDLASALGQLALAMALERDGQHSQAATVLDNAHVESSDPAQMQIFQTMAKEASELVQAADPSSDGETAPPTAE